MSGEEIAVIVLCLAGGYWGVSFLIDRRKKETFTVRSAQPAARSDGEPLQRSLSWTTVLGISQDASIEQIDRAYRLRIAELHLDKAAALGAQARDLAERKSREIEAAYAEACRARCEGA